jgi:hypothetical protein
VGQKSMKVSEDQEFFSSERWKCNKSPSGAHYWIINIDSMTCKFCNDSKPVSTKRFGWTKPETK